MLHDLHGTRLPWSFRFLGRPVWTSAFSSEHAPYKFREDNKTENARTVSFLSLNALYLKSVKYHRYIVCNWNNRGHFYSGRLAVVIPLAIAFILFYNIIIIPLLPGLLHFTFTIPISIASGLYIVLFLPYPRFELLTFARLDSLYCVKLLRFFFFPVNQNSSCLIYGLGENFHLPGWKSEPVKKEAANSS